MLELLQASHRLGGAELARRLGVDERTIRRYAARLAELGIPVTGERGRYGGYRLMPGYKLPPLMFTDDEAAAVVLGLLTAGRLGLPVAGTASALAKVQRVLPAALGSRIEALRHTLGFTMRQADVAAPEMGTVLTLAQAAGQRQRVRLRYRSWSDQDIPRRPGNVRAAGRGNVRAAGGFRRGPAGDSLAGGGALRARGRDPA